MDVHAHLSDMHTFWFWVFSEPALGSKSSPKGQHGSEKTQAAALQFDEEQWKDAICASTTSNDHCVTSNDHCVRFSARHAGKMGLSPSGRPGDY